ncbi:expressed unknown protein [Seminavis robusta]|uniref:Uncharacterized protein n=1 Tax=Seminavis robusta TaxID=568900 RepID=A0A9N8DNW7_9STRA|nr:expressed unknown protein [Seminavis robusta]|eukprot:Sro184_g079930.1 n/a (226) ;mRNA; f:41525-42202
MVPPSHPGYANFCYDFSTVRSRAGQQLNAALDLALKIPLDPPDNLTMSVEAIHEVMRTCNRLIQEDLKSKNPQICKTYIRACQEAVKRQPDSGSDMISLAASYCLSGNNLEGARSYRRALGMPRQDFDVARQTTNLILAQLQCPNMPLEDHHVVRCTDTEVISILNNDMEKWLMSGKVVNQETQSMEKFVYMAAEEGGDLIKHKMPSSPNDPKYFPEEFLKKVQP